jgi:hypothetical protein
MDGGSLLGPIVAVAWTDGIEEEEEEERIICLDLVERPSEDGNFVVITNSVSAIQPGSHCAR